MDCQASDFDYLLPEELIAQEPLEDRSASRLLHLNRATGEVSHRHFLNCVDLLQPGDLLVFNNTRVSALRLMGRRPTGGQVEALLFGPSGPAGRYRALCRPAKKLKLGSRVAFEGGLEATVAEEEEEGFRILYFGPDPSVPEALNAVGQSPLPPYIHRPLADRDRYQTVYSSQPGSAAAPTAGLHFTHAILESLKAKGVKTAEVTLDVGLDTFRPMTAERASDHVMHGERCQVTPEVVEAVENCQGRIIAVGTTSVRTLETFAIGGRKLRPGEEVSRIFISPGYEFKIVDGMFTNFHLPRTTMMLMISALAGREPVMEAYEEAVGLRYRFLSFGDSMLIL
jgi:S-adenosylmethionine:tRNA ribosyltransferase-isomerase